MNAEKTNYEELLKKDGFFIYKNQGSSMMPLIKQGRDLITITKRPEGRLKNHEAILYKVGNRYILHRIIKVEPDGWYRVIGDNNTFYEKVHDDQIIGVLTGMVRNGKKLTLQEPGYKLYVFAMTFCVPLRIFLTRVRRKLKRILHRSNTK